MARSLTLLVAIIGSLAPTSSVFATDVGPIELFMGGNISESCILDHTAKSNHYWLCGKPARTILIESLLGWNAFRVSEGKFQLPEQFVVKKEDKILYSNSTSDLLFGAAGVKGPLLQNVGMHMNSLKVGSQWLTDDDIFTAKKGREPGTPEYEALRQSIMDVLTAEKSNLTQKLLGTTRLHVKLTNGQEMVCNRGGTNHESVASQLDQVDHFRVGTKQNIPHKASQMPMNAVLNEVVKKYALEEAHASLTRGCEAFVCPKTKIGEKQYRPILIQPLDGSIAPPVLTLGNRDGFEHSVSLESVTLSGESNSELPVYKRIKFEFPKWLKNQASATKPDEVLLPQKLLDSGVTKDILDQETKLRFHRSKCAKGDATAVLDEQLKVLDQASKDLAETRTVQLMESLLNHLQSSLVMESALPKGACRLREGVYATREAYEQISKQESAAGPKELSTVIPLDKAQRLFDQIAAMKDIPYGFLLDGCFARAHLITTRLKDVGVTSEKIWIKGEGLSPKARPDVEWGFHVAVAVRVQMPDGRIEKRVIDPALAKSLVTPEGWMSLMKFKGDRAQLTSYPLPYNSSIYQRAVIAYTPSDVYGFLPSPKEDPLGDLIDAFTTLSSEQKMMNEGPKDVSR